MNGKKMKQIRSFGAVGAVVFTTALACPAWATLVPNGAEVTDTSTGLTWRRCAEGQAWTGSTCSGTPTAYTVDQALVAAQAQATSTGSAWRLPNVRELSSVVDLTTTNPAINTAAFPNTQSAIYWTSTPYIASLVLVWGVNFSDGNLDPFTYRGTSYAIRLVRVGGVLVP
jgi:hypothetical protein